MGRPCGSLPTRSTRSPTAGSAQKSARISTASTTRNGCSTPNGVLVPRGVAAGNASGGTTRWQTIIAEHGAAAILPYSYSGTLGLVQLALCNTRLWNRMGASGLKRSICDAAADVAVTATIGAKHAPDPYDLLQSKLILIWGHNPASTNPHVMPIIRRAQRGGTRVVVIDPRRTLTARSADQHIQPKPATDGALALGLLHVIFAEGLHDEAWLEA